MSIVQCAFCHRLQADDAITIHPRTLAPVCKNTLECTTIIANRPPAATAVAQEFNIPTCHIQDRLFTGYLLYGLGSTSMPATQRQYFDLLTPQDSLQQAVTHINNQIKGHP